MNPDRWQKIKALFDAALAVKAADRDAFLRDACAADPDLLVEVERMLDANETSDTFLQEPAAALVADMIVENRKFAAGQTVGHYQIVREIGVGGMGEVYLARDSRLDRNVAIKVLSEHFSANISNLERFTREAKAASALNHPNILVIHEIGEAEDVNYIVSEYINGKTLRDLDTEFRTKTSQVLDIAIQIASALAAAHSESIVHRDIKPENVMVRPDGYVKVLDFGLAKLVGDRTVFGLDDPRKKHDQTAKGVIVGTVNYMSPEQAKGEKVDERTDIFSLGVLIYEMVAGRPPFQGNSVSETFANLLNKDPQPLSRYAANVQDELQRIVSKALRKPKEERYQTMKGMLSDLKDLRENLAFDEKLERSRSSGDDGEAADDRATAGGANGATVGVSNGFTQQIKQNRYLAVVIALVLIAGSIGGYYLLSQRASGDAAAGKRTLAILPFVNSSQDPNVEYLADGIAESIINNLSTLSELKVMSRNSSFRFRGDQPDSAKIGQLLGAETLVTGDIKQLGDKLVINVRMISAKDDSQVWGNQYVRAPGDLIAAQNEIAQAVAQNLRLKLTNSEQQGLAKTYTQVPEANQLYLRGRFHVFKLTPPEVNTGISYMQQAIELDPNFALAYAGISDGNRSLALGGESPPSDALPKAIAAAEKAIQIDDGLAEGHTALAVSMFWYTRDWAKSEIEFKRALELNPNDANAHIFYAHLLSILGRHTEAVSEAKRARELEPLWPFSNALEAQFLMNAGRLDESIDRCRKTVELDPNFWMTYLFTASVYFEKREFDEAIANARKATELSQAQSMSIVYELLALAGAGRNVEARAVMDGLIKRSLERYVPPYHLALAHWGMGDREQALDLLEKGFTEHDPKMTFLKVDPKWTSLRTEPRFEEIMRKMNFN